MNYRLKVFAKSDFKKEEHHFFVLVGDIGGTATRLAVFGVNRHIRPVFLLEFESKRIKKFYEAMNETLKFAHEKYGIEVSKACFSCAGPVNAERTHCKLTNLKWAVDVHETLKNSLLSSIVLLNDFEAAGFGASHLSHSDLFSLSRAKEGSGVKVIIGAGTGLGKSIVADKVLPSEGGHATFPPVNDFELELANYVRKKLKSKTALGYEELVSGPGIANIYSFLRYIKEFPETKYTKEIDKAAAGKKPELISSYSLVDKTCERAFELFVVFCARCASNFALEALAYGGVYIAGGIAPKNVDMFNEHFMDEFVNNSKMSSVLKKIPVNIVLNTDIALYGAAAVASGLQKL